MTALAAQRNTVKLGSEAILNQVSLPIKASTTIYHGSLVVLNAGYLAPATTATGLIAVGRANYNRNGGVANNSAGANGAFEVMVEQGVFRFANSSSGDLIAQTDAGSLCYLVDDQTVAKTDGTGTRSVAGIVIKVDTAGVYVAVGIQFSWPIQATVVADLDIVEAKIGTAPLETVTSGALSAVKRTSLVSVTDTKAYSLADGSVAGQRKSIRCSAVSGSPAGTLTPAHPSGFATITLDAVGEQVELEWTTGGWVVVSSSGATINS